jgi:hypothetical protein
MVSIWWLFVTFFGGGCAGIFLLALMQMSGEQPKRATAIPDQDFNMDLDLNPTQW